MLAMPEQKDQLEKDENIFFFFLIRKLTVMLEQERKMLVVCTHTGT